MNKFNVRLILLYILLLPSCSARAQENFAEEVTTLTRYDDTVDTEKLVLFTGSSSIRFWSGLEEAFPDYNTLNRGFGGSHMSDLLFFADKLILKYRPQQIFIYEGDNDLGAGKSADRILNDADSLVSRIRQQLGDTEVLFITPKPSIARWHLKENYESFIAALKAWATTKTNVRVIDVWKPMLDSQGKVRGDLLIEDNLHMNEKGYDLWKSIIQDYLDPGLKQSGKK